MQDLQAEKIVSLLFETKQTLITSHQYNEGLAYKSEIKLILCKIAADVGDGVKNIQREGGQFNNFKGEEVKAFSLAYRRKKENY